MVKNIEYLNRFYPKIVPKRRLLLGIIMCGVFIANTLLLTGQSLSYNDLINLQKSNLDKVNDFFLYLGWNSHSSVKDQRDAFQYEDFSLTYDISIWKNYLVELRYLSKKESDNIVIYITDNENMITIENETKRHFKHIFTKTENDVLVSKYSKGEINILFYRRGGIDYFNNSKIEIIIFNATDLKNRLRTVCKHCMGTGQVITGTTIDRDISLTDSHPGQNIGIPGTGAFDTSGRGIFGRQPVKRPPLSELKVNQSGRIVMKICIDKRGRSTFIDVIPDGTTIKDKAAIKNALEYVRRFLWEEDPSAPNEQCGKYTLIINPSQ